MSRQKNARHYRRGNFPTFSLLLPLSFFLSIIVSFSISSSTSSFIVNRRNFTIDLERDTFVKDGVDFNYVSGSIHYWRVPRMYWRDRLRKMAACGLDAITTYIHWGLHEPQPGRFNFQGNLDVVTFIRMAGEEKLLVILRPGPFIDAETDLGGIPPWILKNQSIEKPEIFLRTSDPRFLTPVSSWFSRIFSLLRGLTYSNGGPIIMAQVENEYGGYPACDKRYLKTLVHLTRTYLGKDVVLFSVDGDRVKDLECSRTEGVYSTVDFGVGDDPAAAFGVMRMFEPRGPLVNSEFYSGWLDYWGDHHHRVSTSVLLQRLATLICDHPSTPSSTRHLSKKPANVNFYMFHGGTSFGYVNGADATPYGFLPEITSYDYDAPLSEAGDVTDKFVAVCSLVTKCRGKPPPSFHANTPKTAFGNVNLKFAGSLFDLLDVVTPHASINALLPVPMEFTPVHRGFVLYTTRFIQGPRTPQLLSVPGLRDRAYVFLNGNFSAILSRQYPASLSTLLDPDFLIYENQLDLVVENQGRIDYGPDINWEFKGILGVPTIQGYPLTNWTTTPLDVGRVATATTGGGGDVAEAERLAAAAVAAEIAVERGLTAVAEMAAAAGKATAEMLTESSGRSFVKGVPSFFKGQFDNNLVHQADTFFLPTNLSKGQLFVNGMNLGRYWPSKGPQRTLYVPAEAIRQGINDVTIFELEPEYEAPSIQMVDKPQLEPWN